LLRVTPGAKMGTFSLFCQICLDIRTHIDDLSWGNPIYIE